MWLLGGSSHNSVAVEFDKFVAVIEAPLDEERSLLVIEEIVRLVPDKPIRFIINTHAHYDHLGGLRPYLPNRVSSARRSKFRENASRRAGHAESS